MFILLVVAHLVHLYSAELGSNVTKTSSNTAETASQIVKEVKFFKVEEKCVLVTVYIFTVHYHKTIACPSTLSRVSAVGNKHRSILCRSTIMTSLLCIKPYPDILSNI
jgi:hypothetical protein